MTRLWGLAKAVEFEPVPRHCRYILAVYEDDLDNFRWAPPGGYRMNPQRVVRSKTYEDTHGNAPPYLIYLDHAHADVVLAVLLDNRLAKR
ncbi:unnamed protein product, partial [Musa hybrid cultivar]